MTAATPVDVIAEFYDTFTTHDKLAALDVLRDVETLVLVGSKDLITPRRPQRGDGRGACRARRSSSSRAPATWSQLERAALVTLHLRAAAWRRATRAVARSA